MLLTCRAGIRLQASPALESFSSINLNAGCISCLIIPLSFPVIVFWPFPILVSFQSSLCLLFTPNHECARPLLLIGYKTAGAWPDRSDPHCFSRFTQLTKYTIPLLEWKNRRCASNITPLHAKSVKTHFYTSSSKSTEVLAFKST